MCVCEREREEQKAEGEETERKGSALKAAVVTCTE